MLEKDAKDNMFWYTRLDIRVCCVCLFVWAVSHSSLAVCNAHAMYILSIPPQLLHKGERFNKQC